MGLRELVYTHIHGSNYSHDSYTSTDQFNLPQTHVTFQMDAPTPLYAAIYTPSTPTPTPTAHAHHAANATPCNVHREDQRTGSLTICSPLPSLSLLSHLSLLSFLFPIFHSFSSYLHLFSSLFPLSYSFSPFTSLLPLHHLLPSFFTRSVLSLPLCLSLSFSSVSSSFFFPPFAKGFHSVKAHMTVCRPVSYA